MQRYESYRLLHKENDNLQDENAHLAKLVQNAEERVKKLTNLLQKNNYNVLPVLTVCNNLIKTNIKPITSNQSAHYVQGGYISLQSPALCLADGPYVAAGQINGEISLWSIRQGESRRNTLDCNRSSTHSIYRISSSENSSNFNEREPSNALFKASDALIGHNGPVSSLNWHHDILSSVSLDCTLKVWDISTSRNQSVYFGMPASSHCPIDNNYLISTCTKKMFIVDPRNNSTTSFRLEESITAVASTDLGTILGTSTGKLLLFDIRNSKIYQSLQVSSAKLPISRISGKKCNNNFF